MNKRQRREFKKVWRTLKTAFKVLFILIVLFLLLSLLKDFMDGHFLLIEKVNQQGNHIDQLQGHLNEVTEMNTQLNEQLQLTQAQLELESLKVDELTNELLKQQTPQVNIGGSPVVMTEDDVRAEIEPQLKTVPETETSSWKTPDLTTPIVIVGALQLLKSLVFRIPAF
jgi:regulatory protein YycI of two-component signal transduction system YycFG